METGREISTINITKRIFLVIISSKNQHYFLFESEIIQRANTIRVFGIVEKELRKNKRGNLNI
jgi:hypothetical protein